MKILFLTYYFPPLGGSGVIRVSKFIKYLKREGYEISVITVKDIPFYYYDYEILKELSPIKIYRSESLDLARLLYFFGIKKRFAYAGTEFSHFFNKIFFPDAKVGFLPLGYLTSYSVIQKEKPDIIFATSPPYTILLLALLLKKSFSLPLISDFRDLYPTGTIPPPFYFKGLLKSLRDLIYKNSDKIITAHYTSLKAFPNNNKIVFLPNGYDPEDFLVEKKELATKSILYAGNLERNSKDLLFLAEDLKEISNLKIYLCGHIDFLLAQKIKKYENIVYLGRLPHKEVCALMKGADYLLYLSKPHQLIGLKLFEYIGAQRPIIFLGEISEELKMLNERYKVGYFYREVKERIKRKESLAINKEIADYFSFPYLVKRLKAIIETLK